METTRRTALRATAAAMVGTVFCSARAEDDLLPAEEAFRLRVRRADARTIELMWIAAPGTYLYRDRMGVKTDNPQVSVVRVDLPPARTKHDATFNQDVAYYEGSVLVRVTYAGPAVPFNLIATAQGCADDRFCYPPVSRELPISGVSA